MDIKMIQIGTWKVQTTTTAIVFTQDLVEQSLEMIDQWVDLFERETTWIQKKYNVPSLIIRLDCVVHNGKLGIYEVEERPSGVGLCGLINTDFKTRLEIAKSIWPKFKVIVSPKRSLDGDDSLWAQTEQSLSSRSLVLVRAEPDETEYSYLESCSVSSLKAKGNKGYGLRMGFWYRVCVSDFEDLPWNRGFALKPLSGSKCLGLEIWDPRRRFGCSTKERIKKALNLYQQMYCQYLLLPMSTDFPNYPWMIYRPFFVWSVKEQRIREKYKEQWKCIGGLWMAGPSLRLHGATNTVSGPLIVE